MTDQLDDNDNTGTGNSGGALRKQLEETLARLKTLEGENANLKTQARTSAISNLLTEKKYNAKVAKLIPADVEPTAEGVQKWLDEFGDVFNVQKDAEAESGGTDEQGIEDVDTDAAMEYIQTMRQMGNVNGGMLPPDKAKDLLGKVNDPNLTQEGLLRLIHAHGGGVGMG